MEFLKTLLFSRASAKLIKACSSVAQSAERVAVKRGMNG